MQEPDVKDPAQQEHHRVDHRHNRGGYLRGRVVGPKRRDRFFPENAQEKTALLTSIRSKLSDEPEVSIPPVSHDGEELKVTSGPKHAGGRKHRREHPLGLLLRKGWHKVTRKAEPSLPVFNPQQVPTGETLPKRTPLSSFKEGDIVTGSTTDKKFTLGELIGSGGHADVYKATTEDGSTVAVKVFKSLTDAHISAWLTPEQEAAMQVINHPHIARVLSMESVPERYNPFMVMEFASGGSLKKRMENGPIPLEEALPILIQTASALSAIHGAGLVHRDVKPENVLLTDTGAKIVDFGLSAREGSSVSTPSGVVLGSPSYVAPERIRGEGRERRESDVYSWGIMAYKMLTGKIPYQLGEGKVEHELMNAHLKQQPRAFSEVLEGKMISLPAGLESVIMNTLAKNPDDRYPNFEVLLDELERIRQEGTIKQSDQTLAKTGMSNEALIRGETIQFGSKSEGKSAGQNQKTWRDIAVGSLAKIFQRKPSLDDAKTVRP